MLRLALAFSLLASAPCLAAEPPEDFVLSVVGTNDWHGRVERVAVLSGFLKNLRSKRARDGAVILVDGGDVFQGTLESNLGEGAAMVKAMGLVGYDAVAVGNHELDFGPEGPAAVARSPEEDPQGALKARAREAAFPFLSSNLLLEATGAPPPWENVRPSTMVRAGPFLVGIVGGSTEATPHTTVPLNFRGLRMAPLPASIEREARALRAKGAHVVIAAVHAGGACRSFQDPRDLSSCRADEEAFALARALPRGLVDVIVAGHTHQGVAHFVEGVAVLESFANGRAFGRVDLVLDGATGAVRDVRIHPPQDLCGAPRAESLEACAPPAYEGAPVVADPAVLAAVAPDLARARAMKDQLIGVHVKEPVKRSYDEESPLGNLFADLMRQAVPGADVGLMNGGGLRADLPAGPLRFGHVYEAMPFDNRVAVLTLKAADLRRILESNLGRARGSVLSVSGLRVEARCEEGAVRARLTREDGRPVADGEVLKVVTNDFLATGGDLALGRLPPSEVLIEHDERLVRDVLVEGLRGRRSALSPEDRGLYDPRRPRLALPGKSPLRCGGAPAGP